MRSALWPKLRVASLRCMAGMCSLISWLSASGNALRLTLRSKLSATNAMQKSTVGLNWIRSVSHTFDKTKFTCALCVLFVIVVAIPDQTLELYRYTAQSLSGDGIIESLIALVALPILSYLFFSVARFQYFLNSAHGAREQRRVSISIFVAIASLPSLAVACGLLRARVDVGYPGLRQALIDGANASFARDDPILMNSDLVTYLVDSILSINSWLTAGATVLAMLSLTLGLAAYIDRRRILRRQMPLVTADLRLATLFLTVPIVAALLFVVFPVSLPQFISTFGLTCLFFADSVPLRRIDRCMGCNCSATVTRFLIVFRHSI